MKKLILSGILIVFLVLFSTVAAFAASGEYEYEILEDGSARITKYRGDAVKLVIPSEFDGVPVTQIGVEAFCECNSIKNVEIPNCVTSIGGAAFNKCESLESVSFSDGVKYIGRYAFQECKNLQSIVIPDSVTEIGWFAFSDCPNLLYASIPGSVSVIEDGLFYESSNLQTIELHEGLEQICQYAFEDCDGLCSIIFPESLTSIGKQAFRFCDGFESIKIPDNVSDIGTSAFEGCSSLKTVILSSKLTEIAYSTFLSCEMLESVMIPESVTIINEDAFNGCTSMKTVVIPEGTTVIREDAFKGCLNMKTAVLPESVSTIEKGAFSDCPSDMVLIVKEGSYAQEYADSHEMNYRFGEDGELADTFEGIEGSVMNEIPAEKNNAEAYDLNINKMSYAVDLGNDGSMETLVLSVQKEPTSYEQSILYLDVYGQDGSRLGHEQIVSRWSEYLYDWDTPVILWQPDENTIVVAAEYHTYDDSNGWFIYEYIWNNNILEKAGGWMYEASFEGYCLMDSESYDVIWEYPFDWFENDEIDDNTRIKVRDGLKSAIEKECGLVWLKAGYEPFSQETQVCEVYFPSDFSESQSITREETVEDEIQADAHVEMTDDIVEQLSKLAELYERGILTDDEFAAAKAKILQ